MKKHIGMHKKGQLSNVVGLTLIVAGGIVLLLFIAANFGPKQTFEQAMDTCRFSVVSQVATEVAPGFTGRKSPLDINCEKRYVTFYDSQVKMGLNPENMKPIEIDFDGDQRKKFRTLTDNIVNQVIAEELRVCKYQFADGKMEIFGNDDSLFGKNICFVCSEISFASTVKPSTYTTLAEFTEKTTFDDSGTTYYDYLSEESRTLNKVWIQPKFDVEVDHAYMISRVINIGLDSLAKDYGNLDLDTSKRYYVFFEKYEPGAHPLDKNKNIVDNDPENTEQYWVAIVPADDINKYCTLQAS